MHDAAHDAHAVFRARLYDWAKREWERELRADLARLRAVPDQSVQLMVVYMQTLSAAESVQLVRARLKRFHSLAARQSGDRIDDADSVALERWRAWTTARIGFLEYPTPSNKRACRKLVMEGLSSCEALGSHESGSVAWRTTCVRGWRVASHVDFWHPPGTVTFGHSLRDSRGLLVENDINLASWMGIASTLSWMVHDEEGARAAGVGLANLGVCLLTALEELLDGLGEG